MTSTPLSGRISTWQELKFYYGHFPYSLTQLTRAAELFTSPSETLPAEVLSCQSASADASHLQIAAASFNPQLSAPLYTSSSSSLPPCCAFLLCARTLITSGIVFGGGRSSPLPLDNSSENFYHIVVLPM